MATQAAPASADADQQQGDGKQARAAAQVETDPGSGNRAGVELSLRSDVEHPCPKGDGDSQSDQDQGHRAHQRGRGEGVPGAEGAGPERRQRRLSVVSSRFQAQRRGGSVPEPQPRLPKPAGSSLPLVAQHQVPDFRSGCGERHLADDSPRHYNYPLGQVENFIEIAGVKEDRRSPRRGGAEPGVHGSGCGDIEPPGRVFGHDHRRPPGELPGDNQLLLISPAQGAGPRLRSGGRDSEFTQELGGALSRLPPADSPAPDPGRLAAQPEDDVLGETELRDQPLGSAILRE